MEKPWYQSKTLWGNLAMVAGALFTEGQLFGHVFGPEEVAAGMGLVNAILRFTTQTKITG